MARKPGLGDDVLKEVASYLMQEGANTVLEIEVPPTAQERFEAEYREVAETNATVGEGYILLKDHVNKQGMQGRIYFDILDPMPESLGALVTDSGKWKGPDKARINHTTLMFQLVECGFVLGEAQDSARIDEFMKRKFE